MIAITGGGTGGHLNIVKCLLESANKLNIECIYIGSQNGQDKAWFENEEKFKYKYFLPSSGVMNKNILNKIISLFNILKLSFKSKKILKNHKIKAVFSVGGYSAAAGSFGAIFSNIPLFIHEQNSKIGNLNKILKPFSKIFFSAFEENYCSYPIRKEFFEKARIRKNIKNIIFLGGSQGASFINNLALKLAPILNKKNIKIIHQCGKKELDFYQNSYKNMGLNVDCFDFVNNIEEKFFKADLAISRSGASSLFELCANLLPAIFIPYPSAVKNHQFFNAKFLYDKKLCEIFMQDNKNIINDIINTINNIDINNISKELNNITKPNGADFMIYQALKSLDFNNTPSSLNS